jgi:TolB-like protein
VGGFFKELKRRKVYTIAVAYVVVGWLLLQVADVVLPIYDTPDWVLRTFTTLLFLGFPIALVLAWVYDFTTEGVVTTEPDPEDEHETAIDLPSGPSIAVLPFENLSGEADQNLFAQALTGDIVSGLTQSSNLFVLTAGATGGIGSGQPDIKSIGDKLGVSYLLQGSVQKSGDSLRVTALLIDSSNGVQIWSGNYDRELSAEDLFKVQDDIREQIVATLSDLHGVIYATQAHKSIHRPTRNLNAYDCLSVALEYDKFLSVENHLLARESLERAIEIDPQFDSAWAHLSWIYTDEYVYGFNQLPDPMERALEVARKGVRLAPQSYHNHWLLSRVHYFMGNRELFLAEASKALELNSSDGTTLGLIGMYTAWAGDWDRGLEMMEKAKLLNPNYPPYYHVVFGTAAYARGDYENAIETLLKADLSDFPPYLIFLAASYIILERSEDASRQLEDLERIQPGIKQQAAREMLARTFPFQAELVDRVITGLARAGLPAG